MKNNTRKKSRNLMVMMMTMLMMFANIGYINANSVSVGATSAIIMDGDTGQVLFQKNGYESREIASVSKVMTALVVLEEGNIDSQIYITPESTKVKGTTFKLKEGMIISKKDLLYGLMYLSGNDAGDALARGSIAGYDGFISKMNQKAQQLGMLSTRFYDSHGLGSYAKAGAGNNYSTAYDLAILMKEAMKNPEFAAIQKAGTVTTGNGSYPNLSNSNIFMKTYQGATGAKTGYTGRSGNCQVASAYRNGKNLIAVVLNSPKGARDKEIYTLMDYGFEAANTSNITPTAPATPEIIFPVINTNITTNVSANANVSTDANINTNISANANANTKTASIPANDIIDDLLN